MKKARASKLDPYAARLADLDAEKKTLSDICDWLAEQGCKASPSMVSVYLERLRSERRQAAVLAQIVSGSRQAEEVEKKFTNHAAPELDTIIKLHRVLAMQLATQAVDNPELINLARDLTQTVISYTTGQTRAAQKNRELELATAAHEQRLTEYQDKVAAQKREIESALGVVKAGGLTPETLQRIEEAARLL
jgi:DNA-binding phage protein